jgi:hypothetical protein
MPRRPIVVERGLDAAVDALADSGQPATVIARQLGLPVLPVRRYIASRRQTAERPVLAASEAAERDPVDTFRLVFPGMEPMDHQAAYLRETRDTVVLKGRQSGFTQAASALAVHTMLARPGSDTVVVSQSANQSKEVVNRARLGLMELGERLAQDGAGLLRTAGGSRLISLPSTSRSIRGYSPVLAIADEAAWVPDDTYAALRPLVIASGGRIVAQSTPAGPWGWFFELATKTPPGWSRLEVPSTMARTITKERLAREKAELDPDVFAAEYLCKFVVPGLTGLITQERLAELTDEEGKEDSPWERMRAGGQEGDDGR